MRRRDFFAALGGLALCPICAAMAEEHHGPFWNYQSKDPEHGPAHWSGACQSGNRQSPVELQKDSVYASLPPISLDITVKSGSITDSGHSIQLNVDPGNRMMVGNTAYLMKQFHFHSPSEHLTDGAAHAMEVHFVHDKPGGGAGVLGVLLDMVPDTGMDTLTDIMRRFKAGGGEPVPYKDIDPATLIPRTTPIAYSSYPGSLTTPGCDPVVDWFVMREPVKVLVEGYALFNSVYAQTARPIQPLNGRTVMRNWQG
jgi:carbonic anhydrase